MKKLFLLLIPFLFACKTVQVMEYREIRDTIIKVESDTSILYMQIDCDSTSTPIITYVNTENGNKSHISPSISKGEESIHLKVESVSESQEIPVEKVYEYIETEREVAVIPTIYKYSMWFSIVTLLIILIKVILFVYKRAHLLSI